MKKILLILLTMAIVVSVMACQGGNSKEDKEREAEEKEIGNQIEDNFDDQVIFDKNGVKVTLENIGNFVDPNSTYWNNKLGKGMDIFESTTTETEINEEELNNSEEYFSIKINVENNTEDDLLISFYNTKFNDVPFTGSKDSFAKYGWDDIRSATEDYAEKGTSEQYIEWIFDEESHKQLGCSLSGIRSMDSQIEIVGIKDMIKWKKYITLSEKEQKKYNIDEIRETIAEPEPIHVDIP